MDEIKFKDRKILGMAATESILKKVEFNKNYDKNINEIVKANEILFQEERISKANNCFK